VPPTVGVRDDRPPAPAAEVERFFARMRAERFDLAVQLQGGGRHSNPFVCRLGARVTAGSRAPDAPALDRTVPYTGHQHEIHRFLEVVSQVGAAPVTLEPRLAVTDADRAEAAAVRAGDDRPLVVLHPGANNRGGAGRWSGWPPSAASWPASGHGWPWSARRPCSRWSAGYSTGSMAMRPIWPDGSVLGSGRAA
jgi:ADP-heptose:LPS heptosyltransferase